MCYGNVQHIFMCYGSVQRICSSDRASFIKRPQ